MKVRWQWYVRGEKIAEFDTNEQSPPQIGEWIRDADSDMLYRVDQITRFLCPNKEYTVGVVALCHAHSKLQEEPLHDGFDHTQKKLKW